MPDTVLIENLQSRENVYHLLGRLFYKEVDTDLLQALQSITLSSETGNATFDEGARLLPQAVTQLLSLTNRDDVDADYAHTFLGAGIAGNSSAFPFESVYTSPSRLLAQDAFGEVSQIFHRAGFQKADADLLEDHVALEFAYMAELCRQGVKYAIAGNQTALESNLEAQADFFEKHILNWVPRFCEYVLALSSQPIYKAAALLTQGFVQLERDSLEQPMA